jgi:NADH dehydrogenase
LADKKIVVIGAGYAGVHAAKKLAKKYKRDDSVSITLIDRHNYHTMMTELHEVAAHRVEPEDKMFDLRRLFNKTKVKLVTDNVKHVDHDKKVITTEHGTYSYDYLVLGMGGEPNDFGTPGVKENGFTLWSMEDAIRLRRHLEEITAKAAMERDAAKRKAMLTFVVCGSGFTGIEMVGELIEWKERLAKDNKIDAEEISLYVVEAVPTILNMLDRTDADKAEAYLVKNGVKILKSSPIVEVKPESIILKSGEEIPTYTLMWTAGVKANSDAKDFGIESARAGRLKVNEFMEAVGVKDTYVVGDLSYFEETEGKPTPQIVEAAEQTAGTAAHNIAAAISGGEKQAFKGKYHGVMVSIGGRYGVANLGGMRLSGWFANFMKHIVNLYYFMTIGSGYYFWQYIKHEIFHTKDKRNIFRDVTTRYGNVIWTFPLRLYLAWFWIAEGGAKIWGETKWADKDLFSGLGSDSWVVDKSVKMPFEWLQTTTSGASAAAGGGEAAPVVDTVVNNMPDWFAAIMKIMMPTPDVAIAMQGFVGFFEFIMGIAILFGLFTWLFSFASIGMLTMFTLTAMLGWDKFWALPASFALMNGAGRFLGLDYYVLPAIAKGWGRKRYGKQQSIYDDK